MRVDWDWDLSENDIPESFLECKDSFGYNVLPNYVPGPKSFLRSSEEWDLTKIFYEDLHEISFFGRSSLNFFGKPFEDF